jgi:hypothetical protein
MHASSASTTLFDPLFRRLVDGTLMDPIRASIDPNKRRQAIQCIRYAKPTDTVRRLQPKSIFGKQMRPLEPRSLHTIVALSQCSIVYSRQDGDRTTPGQVCRCLRLEDYTGCSHNFPIKRNVMLL